MFIQTVRVRMAPCEMARSQIPQLLALPTASAEVKHGNCIFLSKASLNSREVEQIFFERLTALYVNIFVNLPRMHSVLVLTMATCWADVTENPTMATWLDGKRFP